MRQAEPKPKPDRILLKGDINLGRYTSSTKLILQAVNELADRLVDMNLLVRRLNIVANHVLPEDKTPTEARRNNSSIS